MINLKMSRKGVTPTIAAILLITISIAATGAAYTFVINAQEQTAQGFEENLRDKELRDKSDLNIEHMYRDPGSGNAIMMVRNTGSITMNVEESDTKYWTMYIDGQPVGGDGTSWVYVSGPKTDFQLNPSDIVAIDTTDAFPAASTNKVFKLVGRYGTTDTYDCYNTGSGSSC